MAHQSLDDARNCSLVQSIASSVNWGQLTASTRPFSVGFFSMRASNTSSVSLRTYSRTVWWKKREEASRRQRKACTLMDWTQTQIQPQTNVSSSHKRVYLHQTRLLYWCFGTFVWVWGFGILPHLQMTFRGWSCMHICTHMPWAINTFAAILYITLQAISLLDCRRTCRDLR